MNNHTPPGANAHFCFNVRNHFMNDGTLTQLMHFVCFYLPTCCCEWDDLEVVFFFSFCFLSKWETESDKKGQAHTHKFIL